ncbi:MAG: phosphoribosylglycinamide synthetase C domain-containing protein, partial [Bryobacteraceae bacterium]
LESDLASTLLAAAEGRLAHVRLNWRLTPSICVVLASEGYPGSYPTGLPICGIDAAEATGAVVFHAGTRIDSGRIVTGGGRVLGVTASGSDLEDAISRAYSAAAQIKFDGMHYRKDIGAKGLKRYSKRVGAQPRP